MTHADTRPATLLSVLLSYAVLTLWIDARWAWAAVECAVFLSMAAWAAGQLRRPSPVRGSWWLAPLAAAPVWALVQLAAGRTIYRWATWSAALNWVTWLALFFLARQWLEPVRARHWFLRFSTYFGFALAVLSTAQMFTSGGKIFWLFPSGYSDYVLGPFVNRNQYAAFIEMLLPIALWEALGDRRRAIANCAMAAAMLASVVAGASRAGSILVCAEIAAVLLAARMRGMRGREATRALAVFGLMAMLFTAVVGWQSLRQRLWLPDPLAGRRELLVSSLHMLRDKPGMGFGLGNWPRAYPAYALFDNGNYVNQAHNDWLQWAAEGGLPFLAIQLCLAAMAIPAAWRSVWGIGLISVWMHCLVDYPLQQRPAIGAWFFVLLGVLAACQSGTGALPAKLAEERAYEARAGQVPAPRPG